MKQELLILLSEMRALAVAGMDGNSEANLIRMEQMMAGLPEFHREEQNELNFEKPVAAPAVVVVDTNALRSNETLYTPKG